MTWGVETNIRGPAGAPSTVPGPAGPQGAPGVQGPPGATGPTGPGGTATTLISDTPPVGAANGALWWESDTGYLYAWYNDGTSSQWVMVGPGGGMVPPATVAPIMDSVAVVGVATKYAREDHVHPSDTTKLSKASNLSDVANIVTSRQSLYAAPFDAMAYSGMQVNGSMEVSQENGATGIALVSSTQKYIVDGFAAAFFGTGAMAAQQVATASSPQGYNNSLTLNCTTANSLAGANDGQWFVLPIEGYRWSRLAWGTASAQPVSIGFWVYPNITGTMAVAIQSGAGGRSYVADVPVTASSWQFKTVTIPGDVAGTWNVGNTIGPVIYFVFGAGSGRKITANAWFAGFGVASAATTNFFATTGQLYISGVVVLPGVEAPSAARAPLIMRPYDAELLTCQRYWEKSYDYGVAVGTPTGSGGAGGYIDLSVPAVGTQFMFAQVYFKASKRAPPTIVMYDNLGAANKVYKGAAGKTAVAQLIGTAGFNGGTSDATSTNELGFHYTADARL